MLRGARVSPSPATAATARPADAGAIGKRTLAGASAATQEIQRRATTAEQASQPDAVKAAAAQGTSGAAQALPHLDRIQRLFGRHDVRGVRSHVGAQAADGAAAMGATAFATGDQVAFASAPDLHTVAHEAAHVVQQRAGVQLSGGVGQAGDAYERHADAVAELVVAGRSAEALLDRVAPATSGDRGGGGTTAPVQRRTIEVGTPDAPISIEAPDEYKADNVAEMRSNIIELLESLGAVSAATRDKLGNDDAATWLFNAFQLFARNEAVMDSSQRNVFLKALIDRLGQHKTRPGQAGFEREVLTVINYFESRYAHEAVPYDDDDVRRIATVYKPPPSADNQDGEAPGVLRPEVMNELMTPAVVAYLDAQTPHGELRSFSGSELNDLRTIGDRVQGEALRYFSPFIDKAANNVFFRDWSYASNIFDSTTITVSDQMMFDYLNNRIAMLSEQNTDNGRTIFQRAGFDPMRDHAALDGYIRDIIHAKREALTKIIKLTPIQNQGQVVLVPDQVPVVDSPTLHTKRWQAIDTMCHELMHVVQHPKAMQAARDNAPHKQIFVEGMAEAFAYELKLDLRKRVASDAALKAALEAGIANAAELVPPPPGLDYDELAQQAFNIIRSVGVNNARIGFFLGDARRLVLAPEQIAKAYPTEDEAVYPYDFAAEFTQAPYKHEWMEQYRNYPPTDDVDDYSTMDGFTAQMKLSAMVDDLAREGVDAKAGRRKANEFVVAATEYQAQLHKARDENPERREEHELAQRSFDHTAGRYRHYTEGTPLPQFAF